jgi:hypothetical protein
VPHTYAGGIAGGEEGSGTATLGGKVQRVAKLDVK